MNKFKAPLRTTNAPSPQCSSVQAPIPGGGTPKSGARKSTFTPREPNNSKPKASKASKSLNDQEYEQIFRNVINPSPAPAISLRNVQDLSTSIKDDVSDVIEYESEHTDSSTEKRHTGTYKIKINTPVERQKSLSTVEVVPPDGKESTSILTESDIEDLSADAASPNQTLAETNPLGSLPTSSSRAPPFPSRRLKFDEISSAENSEEFNLPVSKKKNVPSTSVNTREGKRILNYDDTPVCRHPRKKSKSTAARNTVDENEENVGASYSAKGAQSSTSTSSRHSANLDVARRSPFSDKSNTRTSPSYATRELVTSDDTHCNCDSSVLPSKASHYHNDTATRSRTPSTHVSKKTVQRAQKPTRRSGKTASKENEDTEPASPSEGGRVLSRPLSQASSSTVYLSQVSASSVPSVPFSQPSSYSVPSSQLNTEEKLEWLLPRRMVGTWVRCDSCKKWRYIKDIHDPTAFPYRWYCRLSSDITRNNCEADEERLPLKDETLMINNEYAPGSIVWAHVDGYPWWPAILDDDPDYFQFYWFDDGASEIPTQYHVVFFDKTVSRAWVTTKNIRPFKLKPLEVQKMKPHSGIADRLLYAKSEAGKASAMHQEERLRKYGVLARFKGKFDKKECKNLRP